MIYKFSYIPKRKCDVTMGLGQIIGSGISATGSVIGSTIAADKQLQATQETNETNRKIAEDTNKLNYQIFGEANEFNRIEAEKQREHAMLMQKDAQEYNALPNQVSQARQANINPAAVAGGLTTSVGIGSPGAAASSASTPNMVAAQMQTPDLSALNGISSAFMNLGNAAQAFSQAKKNREEAKGQMSLNKWIDMEKEAGIYKTRSEAAANYAKIDGINKSIEATTASIEQMKAQTLLLGEEAFSKNVENAFKSKQMELLTKKLAADLGVAEVTAKRVATTFAYDVASSILNVQKLKSSIAVDFSTVGVNKHQANMLGKLADLYHTQNKQAVFNLGFDEDFKDKLDNVVDIQKDLDDVIKLYMMYLKYAPR